MRSENENTAASGAPSHSGIRVAVLIPCYNEETAIATVVSDFRAALPGAAIYVYDNNSTDGTIAAARRAGAIVRRETRQGKGNVVRRMFSEIDADIYVMVDGDNTYDASSAPMLIETLVRECLSHASEFRPMWQAVLTMLDSDEEVALEPVGRELQTIFERALQVLRSMQAVCRQYQQGGWTIPSARELDRELADLQAFSAGLFKNWPWENEPYKACDPNALAQARAELDRGEYVDLEDLIRDLQSQDPASE